MIQFVGNGRLDTIWVPSLTYIAESTLFMNMLLRHYLDNTFIIYLITAIVEKRVDRIVEKDRFDETLEN